MSLLEALQLIGYSLGAVLPLGMGYLLFQQGSSKRLRLASVHIPLLGLAACMAGLCVLNVNLYRFFARQRGVWFAVRVLPLHWLYFWYCGLAVPLALGVRCGVSPQRTSQ